MLVDRAEQQERSILQIVLDESIAIAHKLTQSQLDILTLATMFKRSPFKIAENKKEFDEILDILSLFINNLSVNSNDVWHLQYCGCLVQHAGLTTSTASEWDTAVQLICKLYPLYCMSVPSQNGEERMRNINYNKALLEENYPFLNKFFLSYENYRINNLYLTTIGTALSLANLMKKTGVKFDLERWIY